MLARKVNIIDAFEIFKQNFHFIKIATNRGNCHFHFKMFCGRTLITDNSTESLSKKSLQPIIRDFIE